MASTPSFTPDQVRAREAQIIDPPPRIPPLTPEEFTPEVREITDSLQRAVGLEPNGQVPEFIATMLRYPKLHHVHTQLALVLMQGLIPARDREIAILRCGWLCQAPFEWNAHVNTAKRAEVLTSEEIEQITVGSAGEGWNEHDRAILKAVEELFDNAMISGETWDILRKTWDDGQLLEFPLLIGQYQGVAYIQNTLRVALMPGDIGLTAR